MDGLWAPTGNSDYEPITCAIDGYVYFTWQASHHDLVLMASASHLSTCNFAGSRTLVGQNAAAVNGVASYYLPCTTPGETMHLACSVANHCTLGQRLTVHVSQTEYAISPVDETTVLIHSDSLARVMLLLGYREDPNTGFKYLDRGYQTEAAAEVSIGCTHPTCE